MFNEAKLRGKIAEARCTVSSLAHKLNINASTLFRKINGASDFTRQEIIDIAAILNLSDDDVLDIFFAD